MIMLHENSAESWFSNIYLLHGSIYLQPEIVYPNIHNDWYKNHGKHAYCNEDLITNVMHSFMIQKQASIFET
jgi:hypothetical protein